jgi:hypothetical protein
MLMKSHKMIHIASVCLLILIHPSNINNSTKKIMNIPGDSEYLYKNVNKEIQNMIPVMINKNWGLLET